MKTVSCIGIIFAAFIYNADITVSRCVIIWNDAIHFPHFKRSEVSVVVKT